MFKSIKSWFRHNGLHPFPLYNTLRNYSLSKAFADFRAAINVALLDFPQGMAYALIAGLPVQSGIFCSALSSITGPCLASSRFVMLGPTNATAVMLLSTFLTLGYSPEQALIALPVLLLLVGVFMFAGAFIRIANITQYISRAVVVGYISAAACLIIVNQLKTVLGLHVPRAGTFAQSLQNLIQGIGETSMPALLTAVLTLVVYLPLKRWAKGLPTVALTLVIVGGLGVALAQYGVHPEMLAPVSASSWRFALPQLNLSDFATLANAALAISFLSLLESSSIAKTLAAQSGDRVDLNQQMLSMGVANFACAFGGGMAVSGSLTRSVLNFKSGAKTAVSSIFSGCLLIAGLFALGPFIRYIPKPALAVLVITVGLSLLSLPNIRVMLKTTRSDATVFLSTFIGGLFLPLDTAIYIGAATSIALFLHKASKPGLKEISFDQGGNLHEHKIIILRLRNAHNLDASVALTIKDLILFARANDRDVIVSGAHPYVERVFKNSGLLDTLTEANFFRYHAENPTISTRDALKRAQEITGTKSADITIYASDKKQS
jgi:SulP family sulfate permease